MYRNETRHVKDEWDAEAIAKDIIKHNPLIIRSKYLGGRKSHIAKYFSRLGYKTMSVVPRNSLSQNTDDDAVTTKICLQYRWEMVRSCQSLTIVTIM